MKTGHRENLVINTKTETPNKQNSERSSISLSALHAFSLRKQTQWQQKLFVKLIIIGLASHAAELSLR